MTTSAPRRRAASRAHERADDRGGARKGSGSPGGRLLSERVETDARPTQFVTNGLDVATSVAVGLGVATVVSPLVGNGGFLRATRRTRKKIGRGGSRHQGSVISGPFATTPVPTRTPSGGPIGPAEHSSAVDERLS